MNQLAVPDVITAKLKVLFCGINPGLYSAKVGHHFAKPGNRFWKVLHLSGFTPYELKPWEDQKLIEYGLGITNLVPRASARASEITNQELAGGGEILVEKLEKYKPESLVVLGIEAYRKAFFQPKAQVGLQKLTLAGISVWVLPNPSGLNAHYQINKLVKLFSNLKNMLDQSSYIN